MGSQELPAWLECIEYVGKKSNIIVVPGGGKFADSIRALQQKYQFNDATAHQLALLAMCQYGYYLKQMMPRFIIVRGNDEIKRNINKGGPLLWLPYSLIEDRVQFELSWDVTSDSISVWLATQLNIKKMILVKSEALSNDRCDFKEHIKTNSLDRAFIKYSSEYNGKILIYSKRHHAKLSLAVDEIDPDIAVF